MPVDVLCPPGIMQFFYDWQINLWLLMLSLAADLLDGLHPHFRSLRSIGSERRSRQKSRLSMFKREEIVHKEVPERNHARGEELRQVEVQPETGCAARRSWRC